MEELTRQVEILSDYIYQWYAIPLLLVVAGSYLTWRTGAVQIVHFGTALKMVFSKAARAKSEETGTITPFQALSTALASTVGNGNIGGVATAIVTGGPGAIFWMWVTAAVGMATKYSEAVLGVHYRVTTERGELASGPMYYITERPEGEELRETARLYVLSLRRSDGALRDGQHGAVQHHRPDVHAGGAAELRLDGRSLDSRASSSPSPAGSCSSGASSASPPSRRSSSPA